MARMKIKDMEAAMGARTPVACGKFSPKPALILDVRQERRVWGHREWHGHKAYDGVRVRYLDKDGNPTDKSEVVGPHEIIGTWENYTSTVRARRADAEAREARVAQSKADAERAVADLRDADIDARIAPVGGQWNGRTYSPVVGYSVVLTPGAAQALADLTKGEV